MRSFRILLTIAGAALAWSATAQLSVYKTYDDLVNKTPKTYEHAEFKKWKGSENSVIVFDRGGKDDLEIECAGIWGFKYKDATFRISKDSKYFVKKSGVDLGIPCAITHLSDVVMYENGLSFLDAMKNRHGQALLKGMCATLSKDLNSDMVVVPCEASKWTDEQILKMVHEHAELDDLAADLEALKRTQASWAFGSFTNEQMRMYVRDFAENKEKARGQ